MLLPGAGRWDRCGLGPLLLSRQLIVGDNLRTEHIAAGYDSGVLTLQIPVAEKAKPRKISITSKGEDRHSINA